MVWVSEVWYWLLHCVDIQVCGFVCVCFYELKSKQVALVVTLLYAKQKRNRSSCNYFFNERLQAFSQKEKNVV